MLTLRIFHQYIEVILCEPGTYLERTETTIRWIEIVMFIICEVEDANHTINRMSSLLELLRISLEKILNEGLEQFKTCGFGGRHYLEYFIFVGIQ
jgi:hypothetical protein